MANKEDATSLRDMVKAKTGYKMTVPAAMKLLNRFTGDLLADAVEAMPLDTKAPYGFIMAYCKKHATEKTSKLNPKLTISLDNFLKKLKKI